MDMRDQNTKKRIGRRTETSPRGAGSSQIHLAENGGRGRVQYM